MDVLLACFIFLFLSIQFSNSMLVCVYYPGRRVFRTSHACMYHLLVSSEVFSFLFFACRDFFNELCIDSSPLT